MFIVINVIDTNLSLTASLILHNPSLVIFFLCHVLKETHLKREKTICNIAVCPSCAKISSNCMIVSGGAGLKVNNCITFILVLQGQQYCSGLHLTPDIIVIPDVRITRVERFYFYNDISTCGLGARLRRSPG